MNPTLPLDLDRLEPPRQARQVAVEKARLLNRVTIGWNLAEGAIAIVAGAMAGSVSLIGFGLDSAIEVSAAVVLGWRLAKERQQGCMEAFDRRATRLVAVSFAALAAYVGVESVRDLAGGAHAEASGLGIAIAALSLVAMPLLARSKRRLAPVLGSQAAASEARQTSLCALLSAVVLAGLALNAALGWWWADPLAGIGIAAAASVAAVRTWRSEALADTCCA